MFDYRRLSVEDVPAWAELLAVAFERRTTEMQALLHWLHQGWEMVAWGAWADERLVAQYSCLVHQVIAPTGMLKVGLSVNMAVHPEFRGRGLVKQIAQPVYAALAESGRGGLFQCGGGEGGPAQSGLWLSGVGAVAAAASLVDPNPPIYNTGHSLP